MYQQPEYDDAPFQDHGYAPRAISHVKAHTWPQGRVDKREFNYRPLKEIWVGDRPDQDMYYIDGMSEGEEYQWPAQGQVAGHQSGSQQKPNSISYAWVEEYLPKEFPHTRMCVGGFHVLHAGIDFPSVAGEFAKQLIQKWSEDRRPAIFVSHGLGCLIVEFLMSQDVAKELTQAMTGVLFLAPPHFGNNDVAWGEFGARMTHAFNIKITNDQIKQFQSVNLDFGSWLERDRQKRHGRSKIFSLFEKPSLDYSRPRAFVEPVVPFNLANLASSRYEQIQADFAGMTNCHSQNQQNLGRIINRVKQLSTNGAQSPSSLDGREIALELSDVTEDMKLAIIQADLGLYRDAEAACTRVIQNLKPHYDPQIQLFYQEQLAKLARDRGDYEYAYKIGAKVLDDRRTLYNYDEASVLYSVGQLSLTLSCQDRLQEALFIIRQCHEAYQTEPFDTMRSTQVMSIYAEICQDVGDHKLAELLLRDVFAASQEHLKKDHQAISVCEIHLSNALARSGYNQAATGLAEHAFQSIVCAQGKAHPNAALATEALANCFRYSNKPQRASEYFEDLLSDLTDEGYNSTPRSWRIRSSLAAVYALQGYNGQCEYMLRYIAKEQQATLGPNHRDLRWTKEALQHVRALLKDKSIDHTSWTTSSRPVCQNALKFFTGPLSLTQEVQATALEPFSFSSWPTPGIDQMIKLLGSEKQEEFVKSLETNKNPELLGVVLRLAAVRDNMGAVAALLDREVPIESKGGFYGTALQAACAFRSYSVAQMLLKRGAEVNSTGGIFGSPLRAAVVGGEERIVRLLLANDAKLVLEDENGLNSQHPMSLLQIAIAFGYDKIACILLQLEPRFATLPDMTFGSPLQEACYKGRSDIVKLLLQNGANPASTEGILASPLEAARKNNFKDIVTILEAQLASSPPQRTSPAKSMHDNNDQDTFPGLEVQITATPITQTSQDESICLDIHESPKSERLLSLSIGPPRHEKAERSSNFRICPSLRPRIKKSSYLRSLKDKYKRARKHFHSSQSTRRS